MSGKRSSARAAAPRGLIHYLGVGISAGLLAFVLLIGILVIVVPAATGSTPMTVLTSSMEPTYPPGTLVIVKPIETADIRLGDPITFQIESGKEAVVTHRVIAITSSASGSTTFTTQGDHNSAPDGASVLPEQIRGKVWYSLPWIGYLNNMMNGSNRGWIVPTIAIGLFLYAGYMVASGIGGAAKKRRLQREQDASAVDSEAETIMAPSAQPAE